MKVGTREELMIELLRKILDLKKDIQIMQAVKDYWDHPDNAEARFQQVSGRSSYDAFMGTLGEFAKKNDRALAWLEKSARKRSIAASHLKLTLANRLRENHLSEDTRQFAANALSGKYDKGSSGNIQNPDTFHKNMQLALAVLAVRTGTGGVYTLASSSRSKNAYERVSNATGIQFEAVKEAWSIARRQRYIENWQRSIELITQLNLNGVYVVRTFWTDRALV